MPSTVIADMAYDPATQTLSVWFRPSGRRYDYFEVPTVTYDALRRSPSKGRYFNAHIRDEFEFAPSGNERQPHFSDRAQTIADQRDAGIEGAKKNASG
jgi:hypothetical protein